jgi:hypothetical protein
VAGELHVCFRHFSDTPIPISRLDGGISPHVVLKLGRRYRRDDFDDYRLLGCDAVYSGRNLSSC